MSEGALFKEAFYYCSALRALAAAPRQEEGLSAGTPPRGILFCNTHPPTQASTSPGDGGLKYATQNMPLGYMEYCELQAFETQIMQGKAFSELPTSAHRQVLHKELSCYKSLTELVHQPGKRDSHHRSLDVNTTPRQTLSQTIMPPICSSKDTHLF